MLEVARRGDDDVARAVRLAVVRRERAATHGRDHTCAPDHRPAERVAAEDGLGQEVVDEILGRVLHHRDLLEHDLALGVDVGERRREDHVRHDVEGALEMAVRDARVDDRRLARRGRVQLAAHLVEDLRDLLGRVRARALEEEVLDEVRHARLRVGLVPRARSDPEAERDRAHVVEALGDQPLARVELGDHVLLHRQIVAPVAYGVADRRIEAAARRPMNVAWKVACDALLRWLLSAGCCLPGASPTGPRTTRRSVRVRRRRTASCTSLTPRAARERTRPSTGASRARRGRRPIRRPGPIGPAGCVRAFRCSGPDRPVGFDRSRRSVRPSGPVRPRG